MTKREIKESVEEWIKQQILTKPLKKHRTEKKMRNPDGTPPVVRIQVLGMQRRGLQDFGRYFTQPKTDAQVRGAEGIQIGEGQSEQHQYQGKVGGGVDLRRHGARGRSPEGGEMCKLWAVEINERRIKKRNDVEDGNEMIIKKYIKMIVTMT